MITKNIINCYYTGKYRDTAHNICNLRYEISKKAFCGTL